MKKRYLFGLSIFALMFLMVPFYTKATTGWITLEYYGSHFETTRYYGLYATLGNDDHFIFNFESDSLPIDVYIMTDAQWENWESPDDPYTIKLYNDVYEIYDGRYRPPFFDTWYFVFYLVYNGETTIYYVIAYETDVYNQQEPEPQPQPEPQPDPEPEPEPESNDKNNTKMILIILIVSLLWMSGAVLGLLIYLIYKKKRREEKISETGGFKNEEQNVGE